MTEMRRKAEFQTEPLPFFWPPGVASPGGLEAEVFGCFFCLSPAMLTLGWGL